MINGVKNEKKKVGQKIEIAHIIQKLLMFQKKKKKKVIFDGKIFKKARQNSYPLRF